MPEQATAAIYVRVSRVGSRDRESASYQTEIEQEERCRAFARSRGFAVTEVVTDVDVSGGRWDRAGLDRVLALAAAGDVQAVIVYRLSRLGRRLRGAIDTVERLQADGVALMSVSESLDLTTASGRMMFNVVASFDEYERELRGEYWDAVKARAHGRGVLIGPTPFGYTRGADGVLTAGEHAAVVVAMFEARAAGVSLWDIAAIMDRDAPRMLDGEPAGSWTTTQVLRTLRSRVYRGELHRRGEDMYPDAHPALVTEQQWRDAQHVRAAHPHRSANREFILSGVLRCAGCGQTMSGNASSGNGRSIAVYRCRVRTSHGRCTEPAVITADRAEQHVVPMLRDRLQGRRAAGREGADPEREAARLDAVAARDDRNVQAYLTDTTLRDAIGHAEWRVGLDALVSKRAGSRATAQAAHRALAGSVDAVPIDMILGDHELLRAALRGEVASITVRRGRGLTPAERITVDWIGL